jgi:hypothetical protein
MKPAVLTAAILEILTERDGEPVPERYILLALSVEYRIKVTFSELRDRLSKLDETKHIIGVRSRDETVVWGISALGKAWLAELR